MRSSFHVSVSPASQSLSPKSRVYASVEARKHINVLRAEGSRRDWHLLSPGNRFGGSASDMTAISVLGGPACSSCPAGLAHGETRARNTCHTEIARSGRRGFHAQWRCLKRTTRHYLTYVTTSIHSSPGHRLIERCQYRKDKIILLLC